MRKRAETFDCECIDCGYELSSEQHCNTLKCPKCGGQMRRKERPGPGQKAKLFTAANARIMQDAIKRRFGGPAGVDISEQDGLFRITEKNPVPQQMHVAAEFSERNENGEKLTELSFSSESPVMIFGEPEVLLHDAESADFSRLLNVGAILKNHNPSVIVGVPVRAWIDEQKHGKLAMRWGTTPDALLAKTEALVDKTLRGVSVGYAVREWIYLKDESESYRGVTGPAWIANHWDALEASLTPVPADPSVGMERMVKEVQAETQKNKQEIREMKKLKLLRAWKASDGKSYDEGAVLEVDERTFTELTEGDKPQAEAVAGAPEKQTVTEPPKDEPPKVEGKATKVDFRAEAQEVFRAEFKTEAKRAADIRSVCKRSGLSDLSDGLIAEGKTVEESQRMVLDKMIERQAQPPGPITITQDGRDSFRAAAIDGLLVRDGKVKIEKPTSGFEVLAGRSLKEIAQECLRQAGIKEPSDVRKMVGLALNMRGAETISGSTTDFPLILAATANKSLLAGYEVAPSTFQFWARIGSLNDFKAATRIKFADVGKLKLVAENGKYTETKRTEKKETIQLGTYARMWTMSRQGIINDDLGAFTNTQFGFGVEARMLPNDLAIAILTANATMTDGFALFSTQHKNYSAETDRRLDTLAHSQASLKYMRGLMAKQTQYQHAEEAETARYLNLRPKVWLVNADNEYYARQTVGSTTDVAQENPGVDNPFKNLGMIVVSDQNIQTSDTDYSHYLFADPRTAPVVEIAFLQGNQKPYQEEIDQTDSDGRKWLTRLDCGAGAVDSIGAVKEVGTDT